MGDRYGLPIWCRTGIALATTDMPTTERDANEEFYQLTIRLLNLTHSKESPMVHNPVVARAVADLWAKCGFEESAGRFGGGNYTARKA
jgi:hypothetical protein